MKNASAFAWRFPAEPNLEKALNHGSDYQERYYRINPLSANHRPPPFFVGLPDNLNLAIRYFAQRAQTVFPHFVISYSVRPVFIADAKYGLLTLAGKSQHGGSKAAVGPQNPTESVDSRTIKLDRKRLLDCRTNVGWSQALLAQKSGLSKDTISRAENQKGIRLGMAETADSDEAARGFRNILAH